jgi:hypothetical protein
VRREDALDERWTALYEECRPLYRAAALTDRLSGLVGDRLTQRLLVVRRVLGVKSARVEEEARGKSAGENGDHHGDGDADTGGEERPQVELHVSCILPARQGPEVGPKVTRTLGRRRLLQLRLLCELRAANGWIS